MTDLPFVPEAKEKVMIPDTGWLWGNGFPLHPRAARHLRNPCSPTLAAQAHTHRKGMGKFMRRLAEFKRRVAAGTWG